MLVLLGIILGLFSATISESFFHKFFGHPFESVKRLYFKNTTLFSACLKPYYQHFVIHHKLTYLKHFFSQFDSKEHKERVDNWIDHNFDEEFRNLIWIERYNLTLKGFIGTLPFAGPFCIGPILIYYFLGVEAFLGSLLTGYIPVWMSKYIHPLIHAPEETQNHGPFIRWFMTTKYAEKILLNHFLHHNDGNKNFNLFLGGDQLIGLHRVGTREELEEYDALLIEFKSKVRSEGEALGLAKEEETSLVQWSLIKNYCELSNPTTKERYNFQKELFKSESYGHWNYENFGFHLYSKNVDFKKWNKRKEFSLDSYDVINNDIQYRGNRFRTGDVLLTNQNSDADGLFSTLLNREINFSHAAVFINLISNSHVFPAVIEINEYGTRAVPLKVFLSKEFNSYVEVFRFNKGITKEQEVSLSREAIHFLNEIHAFDIYQDRDQNHYLNCARTVELIFKRSNIDLEIGNSRYHPATFSNLHTLGIEGSIGKDLLMPDDYALSDKFKLVGALSNSNLNDMLARNLTRSYFQTIWRTRALWRDNFPIVEKIKFHMIKLIQKNNAFSKMILLFLGLSFDEFPSGPATFMSLVSFGDNQMISAVKSMREELDKNGERLYSDLEWDQLLRDGNMLMALDRATLGFSEIFKSEFQLSKEFVNDSLMVETDCAIQ
ncbi:MAG: hypothetical protein K9K67_10200 [Bacteriovoracaceae bacterium]|nr:hypothetical protein [Bacteriovoracaceae bacterium]